MTSFLFDTGSPANILDLDTFNLLLPNTQLTKVNANLSDIHRNRMNILGATTLVYNLGPYTFTNKFFVVAGISFHPIAIIGYPTCRQDDIDIQSKRDGIKIKGDLFIPFSYNYPDPDAAFSCHFDPYLNLDNNFENSVFLANNEIIPPGEPILVHVRSKHIPVDTDVITLPECEKIKGLSVSSALYKIGIESNFSIEVCNNLSTDLHLKQGTCICLIECFHAPIKEQCDATPILLHRTDGSEDIKLEAIRKKSKETDYPEFADRIEDFLFGFQDVLAIDGDKLGCTDVIEHHINLENNTPVIYIPAYRLTHKHKEEINKAVDEMLADGIIEPSKSPYNFPLLAVPKKDKSWRIVVDFRKLNNYTIPDRYPVPVIEDLFASIGSNCIFTSLDLLRGFLQIPLSPSSRKYTAFSTDKGHYNYVRMPFGLRSSPITFVRLINNIFYGMLGKDLFAYLDDLIICSRSLEEHLVKLDKVLTRLREVNLKLKMGKCEFLKKKITYLGHQISQDGISMIPDKISAIRDYPVPKSIKQIQQYLGMMGYYRKYIFRFASKAAPLTELLKKDAKFVWNQEQQDAFDSLKSALMSPPILKFPDFDKKFFLATDASMIGIGGCLPQVHYKKLHPLAFYSRKLRTISPNETQFSVIDLESLAVLDSLKSFRFLIYGYDVTILTDHKPLVDVINNPMLNQKRIRWYLGIQDFNAKIKYVSGKLNILADALSGNPVDNANIVMLLPDDTIAQFTDREKFIEEQNKDKDLVAAKKALVAGKTKSQFIKNLHLDDGLLIRKVKYHTRSMPDNDIIQIVVPQSLKLDILDKVHSHKLAAHPGVERTYDQARMKYFWRNMLKDIDKYVKNCQVCQSYKGTIPTSSPLGLFPTPKKPFERVHMDLIVSFRETPRGYKNILVCVDALTRFTELIPLTSKKGFECAAAFYNYFICKHGVPMTIISDSGREFNNEFLLKLCDHLKVSKVNTTVYHPSSNGLVERTNRKLLEILRCNLGGNDPHWDEQLPAAQFCLNTSLHSSIGEAPYTALYGVPARTPFDIDFKVPKGDDPLRNVLDNAQFRFDKLRRKLLESNVIMKRHHDKKAIDRVPKVGDKVFLKVPVRNELNYKLGKKFEGPFVIKDRIGAKKYIVANESNTEDLRKVHLDHIKIVSSC